MSVANLLVPDFGDDSTLHCPEPGCGFSGFTHWSGRIERIDSESCRLAFHCEGMHEFDLVINQHKGETTFRVTCRPDRVDLRFLVLP